MSSAFVYTCDRCGRTGLSADETVTVKCGILHDRDRQISVSGNTMFQTGTPRKADWCDKCRTELGVYTASELKELEKRKLGLQDNPTLEMQIVELCREFISEEVSENLRHHS